MKKYLTLFLLLCTVSLASAQYSQSTQYRKQNDFMVAVLNNPNYSLYDFIRIYGIHESNTQFLDESTYSQSNFVINRCKELYGSFNSNMFHNVYMKVKASWYVFIEVQNTDVSYNGMGKYFMKHDMFDTDAPRSCPYPELKQKLSIVPLKL